jgi:hypothetical protein
MVVVCTTRLNSETYPRWRAHRHHYYSPTEIVSWVKMYETVVVVEMHNDANEITGIGLVRNVPQQNTVKVFRRAYYNRFRFKIIGRVRRKWLKDTRLRLTSGEEVDLLAYLESRCFEGKTHSKRNGGITILPERYLINPMTLFDLVVALLKKIHGL